MLLKLNLNDKILKYEDNNKNNIFNLLKDNIIFETICKGRIACNLCFKNNNEYSLVRTTTKYINKIQEFTRHHLHIINLIKNELKHMNNNYNININNAMIEIYNNEYKTMGYHTDQMQDLENNSLICIYSCYSNPISYSPRILRIINKLETKGNTNKTYIKDLNKQEYEDIKLGHNSILVFSTKWNKEHLHKIILDNTNGINNNINSDWLGITFRVSKTPVKFINNIPYFKNTNKELKLASNDESKEFYKLKSEENKKIDFKYPELYFTISKSDLLI